MKNIVISANFGHEIMATKIAKDSCLSINIIPNKDNEEEYEKEATVILEKMQPFYPNISIVPFADRIAAKNESWDIIGELKNGTLDPSLWEKMATSKLSVSLQKERQYPKLQGKLNVLFVPQKLLSDNTCGVTAAEQSLSPEIFTFMKGTANLVLGQNFHKVNDKDNVLALAKDFSLYVPGLTENQEVFGIRGVAHKEYFNMYASLSASVGIAGTHTWILLACFPEIPQIILYNKKGVEPWENIAEAYRKNGYQIYAVGYNQDTDMKNLSQNIEKIYGNLIQNVTQPL